MKRIIKWSLILFVLLVIAIVSVPFLIPINTVKEIAISKVKELTGRDLVIAGEIKASLWPDIGVKLQKVSLSNPENFSKKNMVEIDSLTAEVALMPLFSGDIRIKQFILSKPTINLEIDKNNKNNWQFGKKQAKPSDNNNQNDKIVASEQDNKKILPVLGIIKIENGNFYYSNAKDGKKYNLKNINFAVDMPSLSSPLGVKADMMFNNEKINVDFDTQKPLSLKDGGSSKTNLNLIVGSLAKIKFNGAASKEKISGDADVNILSLNSLVKWADMKLVLNNAMKNSLNIKAHIDCSDVRCLLKGSSISLDDNKLTGNAEINFAQSLPYIKADMTSDTINLNPYLKQAENKIGNISIISSAYAAENASSDKIDLSGLNKANADIKLDVKKLIYQQAELSDLKAITKLAKGALSVNIPTASLYSGSAKIDAVATSAGNFSANINANKVQLKPLLTDFAKFDKLKGIGSFSTSLKASGSSQQAIISSLFGDGKIMVSDGKIKGINIAKIVSGAKEVVTGVDSYSEETSFSELSGSFTINKGILNNNDLIMKAPLLRLSGAGNIDLPRNYVNYRLSPSFVATLEGQGGQDKSGINIPIIVSGTFNKLKFKPDLNAIAQDAIKNPTKIRDTVREIKNSIKKPDDLKNLLQGFR
ncbi:MAG: AsmA family protein [Rickettsiales bacterium]